jgi:hypothetical protein
MNHYKYDDITTMFLPEEDWIHLAHKGGRATMTVVNPPPPVAKRTRSQVAKLKKHVELMNNIPRLREIQEIARAKRIQRAGRPVSPPPECVYITAADRKKLAVVKRKRKSWQQWDLASRCKSNSLAKRCASDSDSSTLSEGWY